jgi:predicted ester cyclase
MSRDSIATVRRWFEEVWNQRRDRTIDELLDEDSVCHTDEGPVRGPGEFRERMYAPFLAAFPDLRVEIEAILGEGDQVAVRWAASGTHAGDLPKAKATGERVALRGLTWVHVQVGKMREGWESSNIRDVVRDLSTRPPA